MNNAMIPLLAVALVVWAGVFAFTVALERRVRALEHKEKQR
jgi:CcmD family protein